MCYASYRRAKAASCDREAKALLQHLIFKMPYHALKLFLYRPLRQAIRRRIGKQPAAVIVGAGERHPVAWPIELA